MYDRWNLDLLYKGFDDPAYEADIEEYTRLQREMHLFLEARADTDEVTLAEGVLEYTERLAEKLERLFSFVELSHSVNTDDGAIMAQEARLMRLYSDGAADAAAARKALGGISDLEKLLSASDKAKAYEFYIREAIRDCRHLLSDEAEAVVAAMDTNAGSAWANMRSYLTSTLRVDCLGKQLTLSEVRNLAYSDDPALRKAAYEAELASYEKIQDSVAFALNNIKNQVTTLALKRGYASPLEQTLEDARMQRSTLDAMMGAIEEYLPAFRRYFRKKGELLWHKNGLPWYDLFAPLGKNEKSYSPAEAKEYLVSCFGGLAPDMAAMMARAFDEDWIDFYPRAGKSEGAFCSGIADAKQSRILTNYDGTFSAVDTLAHELGHAYHNLCTENELPLNRSYTMPIAETASTFNELHLGEYALKQADSRERAALLDSTLRETAQCVVDITCRYRFETRVFEESRTSFLMASDLNRIMLECQKQTYGDGLDGDFLNPGMWICKSHYYSTGTSFYNFPYAFGNLFAQGLYSLYKERGSGFMDDYREMLRLTGVHTIEQDGEMLGIDLSDKAFWQKSLAYVQSQIDEFCRL
ncbi:MAG: M3 family oligoendopeptidase [Clostridia bacterium]|nr:M3 family oligoendopeptidase [Clostridia bacterium]